MSKQEFTRSNFMALHFPVMPYCEIKRGPSTQFNESIHIRNSDTKKQLNFFWRSDNTISVGLYDGKETNPWLKNKSVANCISSISNQEVEELCNQYLK